VLEQQRRFKMGMLKCALGAELRNVVSAPAIYAMVFPLLLLDLSVTAYQFLCFPLCRIARVRRRDYLVFDRAHLAYLNLLERINCAYCSYAQGGHWSQRAVLVPIKHTRRALQAHSYYSGFVDCGDAEAYGREFAGPARGTRLARCDGRKGKSQDLEALIRGKRSDRGALSRVRGMGSIFLRGETCRRAACFSSAEANAKFSTGLDVARDDRYPALRLLRTSRRLALLMQGGEEMGEKAQTRRIAVVLLLIPLSRPAHATNASAVGVGRMGQDRHWASDIVGSAVLGLGTEKLFSSFHDNQQRQEKTTPAVSVLPKEGGLSLNVSWRF
jgi:hypothetical protein